MDNAWYSYGWAGPYLGDYDQPGYTHMNEPMMMEDVVDDPMSDPLGLGPDYYGAMREPEGYFNNPMLMNEARQRRATADPPREYGLGGIMGPETHAFMEEHGMPMHYGGNLDGGLPYGYGGMPQAREGGGPNFSRGGPYDDGMSRRSKARDFVEQENFRARMYAGLNSRREDSRLESGVIGQGAEDAFKRAQQRIPGVRQSMLEPYGPNTTEYAPQPFTRDLFMQDELPLSTPWARNMPRQVPLTYDDRRYFERPGPFYQDPDILDEYDRVLSEENLGALTRGFGWAGDVHPESSYM